MTYPAKFVVICHGRTGSSLFGSLLSSHPAVGWAGEEFNAFRSWRGPKYLLQILVWYYPQLYLETLARRYAQPVFGCKLERYYLRNLTKTVANLHRRNWLLIHLQRQNVFQEAISKEVARQTGLFKRYITSDPHVEQVTPQIRIEPAALLGILKRRTQLMAEERQAVEKLPHLQVVYESDLRDPARWETTAGRVFDALGLERVPVKTEIVQTWRQPYSEIVLNYAELVEAVRSSPYASLLPPALA